MARVGFHEVGKLFADGTVAIADFNLEVADGELLVLVGPSGCGKSTLLRMLAGLETVSRGELRVDDRRVNELAPQARNIALVFQNYALYPHMSVRRNLEFPLRMARRPREEIARRVDEVAGLLALKPLLARKPRQLSGGQRQRVAMGRAIVRDPQVFLMDEPLSNLDARLRLQIRSEIAALQRRMGTTMLYVTHDQIEAMTLGDRVAVVDRGRLQQVAEPQALYRRPANLFVAGFIGSPGMNLIRTELIRRADGRLALRWGARSLALPLPAERRDALLGAVGRARFAGLRPEAFGRPDRPGVDARIPVEVANVEALGHEHLLYVRAEPEMIDTERFMASPEDAVQPFLVARVPGPPEATPAARIELGVTLRDLHLFDREGRRI